MATYGADHLGLNRSLRKYLDSTAIKAAGSPGHQGCSSTILHIKLGFRPLDLIMHKVVSNFTVFWNSLRPDERARVSNAWDKARVKITGLPATRRWKSVATPLDATIACLLEGQWHPDSADRWLSGNRSFTFAIGVTQAADTIVLSELKQSFAAIGWSKAASHFCGEGIDHGFPSFEGFDRANRRLVKDEEHHLKQGLLAAVVGGAAVGTRFTDNQSCALCGFAPQDAFHRYYSCPALSKRAPDDFARHWLAKTDWLAERCKHDSMTPPCLYFRGILPGV